MLLPGSLANWDRFIHTTLVLFQKAARESLLWRVVTEDFGSEAEIGRPCLLEPSLRAHHFFALISHDINFEITVHQQLAQPRVLPLQRFEPFDFVRLHAAELLAPRVDRRLAHAMALGHLSNGVFVGLAQNPDHLLVAVSRL